MQLLDGRRQSRSASRPSQVTPREEQPLLSSAGSDSGTSSDEEEEDGSGTSDSQEAEGWFRACWPGAKLWLTNWLEENDMLIKRCKLLASYSMGQLDQFMDGCVIVALMESGFIGWAKVIMAIVLLPQLAIWALLHYHRMTTLTSLAMILFFPGLVLAAVCVLCSLPQEAIEEDTRWWLVNKVVIFVSFSADPLHHLCKDWEKGEHSRCGWWADIGEGVLEAPCSCIFTTYTMFMQNMSVEFVFIRSCITSILSITKTATKIHFYGEKANLKEYVLFALGHTFPHVLWRFLSLSMAAYILRPADISLKENRAELFQVFLLHELLTNSLLLRASSHRMSRPAVLLFGYMMVVLGPPFFFRTLRNSRVDHWIVQMISFVFAVVVGMNLTGNAPTHAYELWHSYRTFVIVWLIITPWSAASILRFSVQENTAEREAQLVSNKLRAAVEAKDPIFINLVLEVEGAKKSDVLCWVTQTDINTHRTGPHKWEGITKLGDYLYCAPKLAEEVLVVHTTTGHTTYLRVQEEGGTYFGIVSYGQKLYCAPADAHSVLVIDGNTHSVSTLKLPADVRQGPKKWAGIAELDGRLYCAPSQAHTVLVVDIEKENRMIAHPLPSLLQKAGNKFFGIAAYDGKLYCCPRDASEVLVIEPDGEMSTINLPLNVANDTNKWSGIAACGRKLYCAPLSASGVLVIDPHRRETSLVCLENIGTGFFKWSGIVEYKRRLYCSPHNSTDLLIIDPGAEGQGEKHAVELLARTTPISGMPFSGRCSGIVASKEKLFCCPCSLNVVVSIDPVDSFLLVDSDVDGGSQASDAKSKGAS